MSDPATTVIIPAYKAATTLERVMPALEPQIIGKPREAVIVDSTGGASGARLQAAWPWARVMSIERRVLPGRARNLGVAIAHGSRLAFLDADTIPDQDWLDELERALSPGVEMVVGAVLNGTPDSAWGTVGYLLEFLDWAPKRTGALPHAVGCNLLLAKETFEQVGGFPDIYPGEDTVLSVPFAARGTLAFAPGARVTHINRVGCRAVLAHQMQLGASWVDVCARVSLPGARLAKPRLAPLAAGGRLLAIARLLRSDPPAGRLVLRHAPLLAAGIVAWSLGVAQYSRRRRRT